jgi:hypothetical protein
VVADSGISVLARVLYEAARMTRAPRPHTLSFRCFRFVPVDEPGPDAYEIIELCDPRNAMRALLFER